MRYLVLAVGRKARDPLLEVAEDYRARLTRYVPTDLVRVREGTLAHERDELLERLPKGAHVVAMDERGKEPTTVELANRMEKLLHRGLPAVVFVIGGADGLHADVKARAHETVALSRLTLPHRLAQVLLLEQLYRAHTILRGEPYHRA